MTATMYGLDVKNKVVYPNNSSITRMDNGDEIKIRSVG